MSERYGLPAALADVLDELVYVHGLAGTSVLPGHEDGIPVVLLRFRYPASLRGLSGSALRARLGRLEAAGAARSTQQGAGNPTLWAPTDRGRAAVRAAP